MEDGMKEIAQAVMNPALQVNVTISLTENQLSDLNEYVKDQMNAYRHNNIELYIEVIHNTCPACREGERAISELMYNVEKRMEEKFKREFIAKTFLNKVNAAYTVIHDF